jgi:hypothetical protein
MTFGAEHGGDRRTRAVEMFHETAAPYFLRAIKRAKAGDGSDLRLFLECLRPPPEHPVIACGRSLFPSADIESVVAIVYIFDERLLSADNAKAYLENLERFVRVIRDAL